MRDLGSLPWLLLHELEIFDEASACWSCICHPRGRLDGVGIGVESHLHRGGGDLCDAWHTVFCDHASFEVKARWCEGFLAKSTTVENG